MLNPLPADGLPTSVATATLDPSGAARYTFELESELPELSGRLPELLQGTTVVHTGSIAAMLQPGADDVLRAVEQAHPLATITYDPNYRPTLITDVSFAREQAEKFVALADLVKASDEDLRWLYPQRSAQESARAWLAMGPAAVIVTRGSKGPWALTAAGEIEIPAPVVDVVDTVGAGDSFMAALIAALVDSELDGGARRPELHRITLAQLEQMLRFAARAAAITVSRAGANPPSRIEIKP